MLSLKKYQLISITQIRIRHLLGLGLLFVDLDKLF